MNVIAIHGGAGTILREDMSPQMEQEYILVLQDTLEKAYEILQGGGTAMDAIEKAVCLLEDSPLFNAGKGAVFTANGEHELDASIMNGYDLSAGAVAGVRGIKNPVSLARKVITESDHVMLAGTGAEEFGRKVGATFCDADYFYDELRFKQWEEIKNTDQFQLDHSRSNTQKFGTVGAVALDSHGNLAAATSTGGMTNKKFGRLGDSPIIGAGTYANNNTCAVSCTGSGEFFIRSVVAYSVSAMIEFAGKTLHEAGKEILHHRLPAIGGDGGLIAIDKYGNVFMDFNTEGMYRGSIDKDGNLQVAIYENK